MRLKIYRAANMPAAMARVRAELGTDALILGTRRVSDGVEVTAALEDTGTLFALEPVPAEPAERTRQSARGDDGLEAVPGSGAPRSALEPAAAAWTPRSRPSPRQRPGSHQAASPARTVLEQIASQRIVRPRPSTHYSDDLEPLPASVTATGTLDDVPHAIWQEGLPPARNRPEPRAMAPVADPARAAALAFHGVSLELAARLGHGALEAALARVLPFGSLPLEPGERPLLLTGLPGAGKTLTAARLATRLVMGRVTPLVITADGKRAGATEQLAAFTKLLGIGLVVASHPVTIGRALTRRQDGMPVLIDGPGTDPFDPAQAEEFRATIDASGAVAALVLPAGLDPAEAAETAIAFAEAGASLLVVTRLDLARRLGSVLAAADAARLPLAEAGIGPGAADGLVPLTPAMLAIRLMQTGTPRHASQTA